MKTKKLREETWTSSRTSSGSLPFPCQTSVGVESPHLQGQVSLEFWKFDIRCGLASSYDYWNLALGVPYRGPTQKKCRWH